MTAANGPQLRRVRETKLRDRRPISARVKRFSTLFDSCRPVHSVVQELGVPHMIDCTTRLVAVPNTHADDVCAALEHRRYVIDLTDGGVSR